METKYNAAEGGLMDVEPKKKRDPKKAHLHRMEIERGHGKKGFIARHVEHRHDDGEVEHGHPEHDAKFPLANKAALDAHMEEHMPEEGGGAAEEQGESPEMQAGEEAAGTERQ